MSPTSPFPVFPEAKLIISLPFPTLPEAELIIGLPFSIFPEAKLIIGLPFPTLPEAELIISLPFSIFPEAKLIISLPFPTLPEAEPIIGLPFSTFPEAEPIIGLARKKEHPAPTWKRPAGNEEPNPTHTMSILNSGFSDHTNSALIVSANHIARSLSTPPGSGFYPSPDPDLATLRAAIAAFAADMQKGVKPGAAEARASSRAALTGILKRLAIDLEGTTPGDRAKLAHTGYDLRKPRERNHSPLAAPGNVRAMPTGNRGEARLDCRRVKGTLIYEARASQDPAGGPYVACPPSSSKRKLLFKGLERGTDWFFQVRAIGANGPGPWSDPAMMMVV